MSEAVTKREIILAVGRQARLFNNPVGNGWQGKVIAERGDTVTLKSARRVAYGLFPGSSDLVGWSPVLITPAHVGHHLAVFSAIEVKAPLGRHQTSEAQHAFINAVLNAGGFAGVAKSVDEARHILGIFS